MSLFSAIAWVQDLHFHNLDRLWSVGHAWVTHDSDLGPITGTCVLDLSFSWLNVDSSAAFLLSLKPTSWTVHSAWVPAGRMLHRRVKEGRMLSPYPAFQGVPSGNLNFLTPWSDPTGAEHARLHVLHYCPRAKRASSKPLPVSKARQGGSSTESHLDQCIVSSKHKVYWANWQGVTLPGAITLPSNKKLCQSL